MRQTLDNQYTPIANQDDKLDIIEHIHQDHPQELLVIAQNYCPEHFSSGQFNHAQIIDIYQEGMLLELSTQQAQADNSDSVQPSQPKSKTDNNAKTEQQVFIEFELKGDLEEQVLYLAYLSMLKQGEDFSGGNKKQFFTVVGKQQLSKNMIRLTIKSETPLPEDYAGYAYGFMLKTLGRKDDSSQRSASFSTALANLKGVSKLKNKLPILPKLPKPPNWLKQKVNMGLLQLVKHLSSEHRQRLLDSLSKDVRIYTLRSAYKSHPEHQFLDMGHVDVFVHGGSAGSRWVDGLQLNDVIISRNQSADRHEHLVQGRAVLIADETAYPAVAGILETWQNPIPPHVIVISSEQGEQGYFLQHGFEEVLPKMLEEITIHRIVCSNTEQGKEVIEVLKGIDNIDVSWGALENNGAKQVRHYLRNERKLSGKNNRIKGYWRLHK